MLYHPGLWVKGLLLLNAILMTNFIIHPDIHMMGQKFTRPVSQPQWFFKEFLLQLEICSEERAFSLTHDSNHARLNIPRLVSLSQSPVKNIWSKEILRSRDDPSPAAQGCVQDFLKRFCLDLCCVINRLNHGNTLVCTSF